LNGRSNSEFGGDHGFYSNEAGYIKDEGYFNTSAKNVGYAKPEIYISLTMPKILEILIVVTLQN